MLTIEQRKQALDEYRAYCTGIVSRYEWPAEDDWLLCWELATQAAVVRVAPEVCGVCAGTGTPLSGLPCICKGLGTQDAEVIGLRERVFDLERNLSPSPPALGEGWISVKERRPDKDRFLVAYKDGSVGYRCDSIAHDDEWITHWMPTSCATQR